MQDSNLFVFRCGVHLRPFGYKMSSLTLYIHAVSFICEVLDSILSITQRRLEKNSLNITTS